MYLSEYFFVLYKNSVVCISEFIVIIQTSSIVLFGYLSTIFKSFIALPNIEQILVCIISCNKLVINPIMVLSHWENLIPGKLILLLKIIYVLYNVLLIDKLH